MNNDINLVWIINKNDMFETDWLYELLKLGGIRYNEIEDLSRTKIYNNAIIVFNHASHEISYDNYFELYEKNNIPFIAIQLSDETLGVSYEFYKLNMCKYVFRNYYHPFHENNPNVKIFGMGYKKDFNKTQTNYYIFPWYNWCFIGTIHSSERIKSLKHFENIRPYCLITGDTFGKGVDIATYKEIMCQSRFALCLMGQGNIETFRIYEAMEANCIPVVIAYTKYQQIYPSYWHKIFPWISNEKDLPFIISYTDSWEDASSILTNKLESLSPQEYLEMRKKLINFWKYAKKQWANELNVATNLILN